MPIQLSGLPRPQGRVERSSWRGVLHHRTWPPIAPVRRSPVLGAIQLERLVDGLKSKVQNEGDRADQDADNPRRGDGQDQQPHSIGHSIRPSTAVPPTVLVFDMGGGSLFLEGWRDGPSAYLCPADAVPLRRELARSFGSPDSTPSDGQGEAL